MSAAVTERTNRPHLLDTSSVLALIEDEPGADRVEELLRNERVLLPFVVGLETYYITCQERSQAEADRRLVLLRQLGVEWLDQVSDRVVVTAGRLKAAHRISFADALIAAFAVDAGAVLVHKDLEYEAIASVVEQERLPYKAPR